MMYLSTSGVVLQKSCSGAQGQSQTYLLQCHKELKDVR